MQKKNTSNGLYCGCNSFPLLLDHMEKPNGMAMFVSIQSSAVANHIQIAALFSEVRIELNII